MALKFNQTTGQYEEDNFNFGEQFAQSTAGLTSAPIAPTYNSSGLNINSLTAGNASGGRLGLPPLGAGIPTPQSNGFGLDLGTFNMVGNALGGIGSLAKGYAALKGLGLAKKELAFKREAFDKNFGMQRQAYDDSLRQYNNVQGERQAFVNATHANPSLSNIQNLQLPSA